MCKALGYSKGMFPMTERAARKTIALPFYNALADADAEHVVSAPVQTLDKLPIGATTRYVVQYTELRNALAYIKL